MQYQRYCDYSFTDLCLCFGKFGLTGHFLLMSVRIQREREMSVKRKDFARIQSFFSHNGELEA